MNGYPTQIQSTSLPSGVQPLADPEQTRQLWGAAKSLEATFTKFLLSETTKNLPGTDGAEPGNDVYNDIYQTAISEKLADKGTLGLAKEIYADSSKLQRHLDAQHAAAKQG